MNHEVMVGTLPTPLAQIARRVRTISDDQSADYFLTVSYLAEAAIKLIAIAMQAALTEGNRDHAYRFAHSLIRADGLGDWERVIREATSSPASGFFHPDMSPLLSWATQKRHDEQWYLDAAAAVAGICDEIGCPTPIPDRKPKVLHLITALVEIRNKTKAHGAIGPVFFATANLDYAAAVEALITHCPLFSEWNWLYLYRRADRKHGVSLRSVAPKGISASELEDISVDIPGGYFWPANSTRPYPCFQLIFADQECREFWLPNGGYRDPGPSAEFIDYGSGKTSRKEVPHLARAPVPLPKSETHGAEKLDVQSNLFGNLPSIPRGYVRRRGLEEALEARLRDSNHHIITLHGRGGIGKTSLAIRVCHKLAADENPPFDAIIWFSARDLELKPTGPSPVRPAVINLEDVAETYGHLFGDSGAIEMFGSALQGEIDALRRLFVLDNFETMTGTRELHEFLDMHTHLPNKVLI
jgi:hypothetical protein